MPYFMEVKSLPRHDIELTTRYGFYWEYDKVGVEQANYQQG